MFGVARQARHRGNMKKHMIRMHAKVRRGGGFLGGFGKIISKGVLGVARRASYWANMKNHLIRMHAKVIVCLIHNVRLHYVQVRLSYV